MKRLFTLLLLTLQFALLNSQDWKLSVEPIFGMKYGEVDEYLYTNSKLNNSDKISELNWEITPELYAGIKIENGWKILFNELAFEAGLPMKTGAMEDSDWLNAYTSNYENYKTNFSRSDNYLDYDFSFGTKIGTDFTALENSIVQIEVKPFIGFDYNKISFTAKDGTYWYGKTSGSFHYRYDDENNRTIGQLSGDVIAYSRQQWIYWLGLESMINIEQYSIVLGFQIAPLHKAESIDLHFQNNSETNGTAYLDATESNFSTFKWNFGIALNEGKKSSLKLIATYFYVKEMRGDEYEKGYDEYKRNSSFSKKSKSNINDGGAAEHYFDLSFSYRFKIF